MTTATAHAVHLPDATPTDAEITAQFEAMLPELQSRADAIARSIARDKDAQEEAAAEVLALGWANYRQAARRGRWLSPGQTVWFAWHGVRSGRTLAGQSSQNDVLDPRASWSGRVRVLRLPAWPGGRRRQRMPFDRARMASPRRLGRSLTTQEHESPAERARVRIDWAEFAAGLSQRHAAILCGIVEGWQGKEIAEGLGVSQGRIVQQKGDLASKIIEHFGPDIIP